MTYFNNYKMPYMKEDDVKGSAVDEWHEEVRDEEINEEISTEETNDEVLTQKEEAVPLKKYLSEKQRRKEIEKRLRELEEKSVDTEILSKKNQIKKEWIDKGYDEEIAELMAKQVTDVYAEVKKSSKKNPDEMFDEEITDLAESDALYEDAPIYKDQIKALMKEGKSAEEAYIKLRGKTRLREMLLNKEQVAAAKRSEVESKKVATTTAGKSKDPYPLDDKDKKALKRLQEVYPDRGWTAEKYYKSIHKE